MDIADLLSDIEARMQSATDRDHASSAAGLLGLDQLGNSAHGTLAIEHLARALCWSISG